MVLPLPCIFEVRANAAEHAAENRRELVTGYITTATVISLAETLLDKRGGYLSNDIFPPGVWMDNVPNWEFGVLTQIRDVSRSFRMDFSRSSGWVKSPLPMIFMPMMPWPCCRMILICSMTGGRWAALLSAFQV